MKTALWWIRRDLRLSDNQALAAAINQAERVLPVFVLDPKLLNSVYTSEKRLAFLYAGLKSLDGDLRALGSYLVVRQGDPVQVLADLLGEVGGEAIFAEADFSPYARQRDQRAAHSLPVHFTSGAVIQAPEAVLKADGKPYTVFTPYRKAWLGGAWPGKPLPAPSRISTPPNIASDIIPAAGRLLDQIPFTAGETEAQRRLDAFTGQMIMSYGGERDRVDLDGTSGLSPYLRFGMLSARQAAAAANLAAAQAVDAISRQGAESWLNELIWRDFYVAILYHFPEVRQAAFRPALRDIPWQNDANDFAAWQQGCTGYPIVDAAMRQLVQTGWMHNRARMIAASFLTKDLLVDWRWGEAYFMQHLIDGDPAANNGGWQWTAGTGTDAAPYFRIFNPILQGRKFDPQGAYVRRWVPELAAMPDAFIHAPWEAPIDIWHRADGSGREKYPAPIVDHALARQRVLLAYRSGGSKK